MVSKFPDSDTGNRNVSDAMSKLKISDTSQPKLSDHQKQPSFDSGILSEADFSQTFSSEIDILSSGPSSEYAGRKTSHSHSLSKSSSQFHKEEEQSLSSCKCDDQVESDRMGLSTTDSGIYTDVTDRYTSDSKLENCLKLCSSSSSSSSSSKLLSSPCIIGNRSESPEEFLWYINPQDCNGDTRIHTAIIEKDEDYVDRLLDMTPSSIYLDIRNYYYYETCLHLSVLMNLPHITRRLFLFGAKTGIEDINGNTALHLACQTNNLECVTELLRPLTVDERPLTTDECGGCGGYHRILVLDWPAKYLNEYNYDGLSCLHLAAMYDDDGEVLNQLCMYGADVNITECKGGYTILHKAVESGNEKLVRFILQHPAIDINKKNYARQTAYHLSSRYPRIRQLLVAKGSEVYASEEDSYSDESDSDGDFDLEYDSD